MDRVNRSEAMAAVRAEYDGRLATLTDRVERVGRIAALERASARDRAEAERLRRRRDPAARAADAVAAARRRAGR